MNKLTKQLKRHATEAKLSAAEKRELKARVVSYMEYHPRAEKVAVEKAQAYIESQPYTVIELSARYLRYGFAAFAVFFLVIVPSVAERSVPGDVLYPIKVNVNEEVRGTLAFSKTQRIEWETERLERRIAEVRLLESEGKLTDEVEAQAAEAVQLHARAAQDGINRLKETDADEAGLAEVAFTSALEVQSAVLAKDDANDALAAGLTEASETGLAQVVREAKEQADATRGSTTPSYEKTIARLERETTRAYELFAALEDVVSDKERAEIERRLADIERKIELGRQEEPVVTEPLLTALADIRKLISFMTDIDVRINVPLDTLIPVTLTEEERAFAVAETIVAAETFLANWAALNEREDTGVDADMEEKVDAVITDLEVALEAYRAASTSPLLEQEVLAEAIASLTGKLSSVVTFEADGRPNIPASSLETATSTATTTETATSTDEVTDSTEEWQLGSAEENATGVDGNELSLTDDQSQATTSEGTVRATGTSASGAQQDQIEATEQVE